MFLLDTTRGGRCLGKYTVGIESVIETMDWQASILIIWIMFGIAKNPRKEHPVKVPLFGGPGTRRPQLQQSIRCAWDEATALAATMRSCHNWNDFRAALDRDAITKLSGHVIMNKEPRRIRRWIQAFRLIQS